MLYDRYKDMSEKLINRREDELSLKVTSVGDLKKNQIYRERVLPDDLPSMVDPVGYVDPNKRIEQMREAGIRIEAWQNAVYDFENYDEEEDDGYSLAPERNDWDDLEMLSAAEAAKISYKKKMYEMYLKALKDEKRTSVEAQKGNEEESVEKRVEKGEEM